MGKAFFLQGSVAALLVALCILPVQTGAAASLLDGEWLVEDIGGGGVADNVRSTLRFDPNGIASGSGGCNRFSGSYASADDGLGFGPLAATRMACPPPAMDQEAKFFVALSAVRSARVEGPSLLLFSAGGAQLVKLKRL